MGRHFPEVPPSERDGFEYPMPLSDLFWSQYGESIADFRNAVRRLLAILDKLALAGPLDQLPRDVASEVLGGRAELHSLLLVSPALGIETDGSFSPRWVFPSMLAMLAFSIWQELMEVRSVRHCKRPRCRKVFFANRSTQEYCSARCRQAEEKSRQRRK